MPTPASVIRGATIYLYTKARRAFTGFSTTRQRSEITGEIPRDMPSPSSRNAKSRPLSESVTLVNPLHHLNAESPMLSPHQTIRPLPMLVTLFGIVMFVNPLQRLNAPVPMLVTVSGIVILVNSLHSSDA